MKKEHISPVLSLLIGVTCLFTGAFIGAIGWFGLTYYFYKYKPLT